MSWSKRCHRMSTTLVEQFCELKPKHTAKWFARLLGVSVRTGKRYASNPELFPEARVVELLSAIEREERRLEHRRRKRLLEREAVRREIQAVIGLDRAGMALPTMREGRRRDGDGLLPFGASVPNAGHEEAEKIGRGAG